jgi:electron transfer flavoprotein beta subunit
MKILVCVKSVPDSESSFRINNEGTGYDDNGLVFHVNEYDLYAMEEAVRIRERFGDAEISVVSAGPPRVEGEVRKAMGLGADHGVIIDDSFSPAEDALSVASLIAAWAKDKNFDLILCGVMSEDMQRCQTGPMLAQILGLPCATTVVKEEISDDKKTVTCERELEGGVRERVLLPLPALLTIQSGINAPRYASLSNVLRIKKLDLPVIPAESLGAAGRCESVVRAYVPDMKSDCLILEGGHEAVALRLIEIIRSKTQTL